MDEILKVNKANLMNNLASCDKQTERATAVQKPVQQKTGSNFQGAATKPWRPTSQVNGSQGRNAPDTMSSRDTSRLAR